jgi:DNA repair protein RecN (Recombination protein N)
MNSRFQIEFTGSEHESGWTSSGFDQVVFMIATNPGEPLRRLEHIASGGELSRVMLALKASVEGGAEIKKSALARMSLEREPKTPSPAKAGGSRTVTQRTLVFDEIDIGIGGSAAEAVGRKLKTLAIRNQVLCVTHLAQIATFADHHYVIEKKQSQGRARTSIRLLTAAERTEEVARMLSGAQLTEASRKHAQQMIKTNA